MRSLVFENSGMRFEERAKPEPGPGEALVRVSLAGICHTDLELLKGYMNFSGVAGHEFVGVVEAAPHAAGLVGSRVVADINIGCGSCPRCYSGDSRHCPSRRTLGIQGWDGAFAQYLLVPLANIHLVPKALDDHQAVFAELLAAALEVGQQVHILAGQKMAVLGDGKLGLLAALGLRHACPGLVLLGKHEQNLAIAAKYGVTTAKVDEAEYLGPFDLLVEATGSPDGLNQALDLVRPEGTIVVKSTVEAKSSLDLGKMVVNEITLVGSRCGNLNLALKYLETGLVDATDLIQAEYPMSEFKEAMAVAARPGALKVLVRMA